MANLPREAAAAAPPSFRSCAQDCQSPAALKRFIPVSSAGQHCFSCWSAGLVAGQQRYCCWTAVILNNAVQHCAAGQQAWLLVSNAFCCCTAAQQQCSTMLFSIDFFLLVSKFDIASQQRFCCWTAVILNNTVQHCIIPAGQQARLLVSNVFFLHRQYCSALLYSYGSAGFV